MMKMLIVSSLLLFAFSVMARGHVRWSLGIGVGPFWYLNSPFYYPYPYSYPPPNVIVLPQTPTPQPPVQNWYYCESSKEYYPYVSTCPAGWKIEPVTPRP